MADPSDATDVGPVALPAQLIAGGSVLGRLVGQAQRLGELQRQVDQLLPATLRGHCIVASLERGHLCLLVSNSVRATQLRYLQKSLLTQLGEQVPEPLHRLRIAVRPPRVRPAPEANAPTGVSPAAAAHLTAVAGDETDPELRKALLRLARRIR